MFLLKRAMVAGLLLAGSMAFATEEHVTISGCTSTGVEGCIFLSSPQGSYALYVAAPRPLPRRGVSVTGTISDGPNICMAGPGIKVEKWSYTNLDCPK